MKTKYLFLALLIFSIFVFFSCSPNMVISVAENANVNFAFSAGASETLNKTLSSLTGMSAQGDFYNKSLILENLSNAGFDNATVEVLDDSTLFIETDSKPLASIASELSDLLVQSKENKNELKISISPEKIQNALAIFPEEIASYTELLMAPVFTGEEMTQEDYIDLLSLVYGQTLANEAKNSIFRIEIRVPAKIKKATSTGFSSVKYELQNTKAIFTIPFIDFLCLNKEQELFVSW